MRRGLDVVICEHVLNPLNLFVDRDLSEHELHVRCIVLLFVHLFRFWWSDITKTEYQMCSFVISLFRFGRIIYWGHLHARYGCHWISSKVSQNSVWKVNFLEFYPRDVLRESNSDYRYLPIKFLL